MDRPSNRPLSVEEAKDLLRRTANETGLSAYVKHRPYVALATAFTIGVLLGGSPAARDAATRELIRVLLRTL